MKVAFYMTTILNYGGGLEKYLIDTAANLSGFSDIEQIDIITMNDKFTNNISDLLSLFYFKKRDKSLNYKYTNEEIKSKLKKANYIKCLTLKELKQILNNYDVIYSKNELLDTFLIKFLIGYNSIPPVILGGHTPLKYPIANSFHAKLHNFLYTSFIYKFLAGPAKRYHALNEFEEDIYIKTFKTGVFKIYNPFDLANFKTLQKEKIFDLKLKNKIGIIWVGRLTEQKGIDDLAFIIESINQNKNNNNIQWNIFGDGELKDNINTLVSKYSNVKYYGHLDNVYMPNIYSQNQIFITTSKWEGYPYTVIEAVAAELKCIGYNIPGVSDILKTYSNGILVEDRNKFISVLKDNLTSKKKRFRIDKKVFDQSYIYEQILNLLKINNEKKYTTN